METDTACVHNHCAEVLWYLKTMGKYLTGQLLHDMKSQNIYKAFAVNLLAGGVISFIIEGTCSKVPHWFFGSPGIRTLFDMCVVCT